MVRHSRCQATRHRRQRGSLVLGIGAWVLGLAVTVLLIGAVLALPGGPRTGDGGGADPRTVERMPTARTTAAPGVQTKPSVAPAVDSRWRAVLDIINRRRAIAWRLGRPDLLRRVYTAGSPALNEDREMLAGYVQRGLRVMGARLRFVSVSLERRQPRWARLIVVDRLGAAITADRAGHRERLPHDLPTRHRIDLRKVGNDWRISRVVRA